MDHIEATVSFAFGEAKVKFTYEGNEYAMRMSREDFDSLVHPKYEVITKIGVVKE